MDYEVLVIGAGPGGYVAAIKSAQLGMKTCIIENAHLGGVCLNEGCIPTKTFIKTVNVFDLIKESESFGIDGVDVSNIKVSMKKLQKRKKAVVRRLVGGIKGLLSSNKVTVINGKASFEDPHTVKVGDDIVTAENIIIATGSTPSMARFIERKGTPKIITSTQALDLDHIPESLAIIGGGVIGIEFAYIFSKLGSKVTVIELMDNILPMVDKEISTEAQKMLEKCGVTFYTGARVKSVEDATVHFEKDGKEDRVEAEYTLLAVGRTPNTEGLKAQDIGIRFNGAAIKTDSYMRTNISHIYAIGDVNGKSMLAHTASHEGIIAVENIMGKERQINYERIPSCIYLQPEIASIGLTEDQARERYSDIKIGEFPLLANGKALVEGETTGKIKVIVDGEYGEILGVHIFGIHATDMIGEIAVAMNLEATGEEIIDSVHPHPTVSEIIPEAFMATMGRAIHF